MLLKRLVGIQIACLYLAVQVCKVLIGLFAQKKNPQLPIKELTMDSGNTT